jgi:DNA-directed RNA polymerase subunit M/transcription elongation factor TFIIS
MLVEFRSVINGDHVNIKIIPDLFDRIRSMFNTYGEISSILGDLEKRTTKSKEISPNTLKLLDRMARQIDKFDTLDSELDKLNISDNKSIISMRKLAQDTLALKPLIEDVKKGGDISVLLEQSRDVVDADYNEVRDFLVEIGQLVKKGEIAGEEEEYEEFIYNIVDLIDKVIFEGPELEPKAEEKGVEKVENKLEKSKDRIRKYVSERVLYSNVNPFHEKGFLLNKKEEESYKMGTKGTKGITTCGVCKMDNIIIYSAQKRGMDEGETIFNTCVDCGHKWVIR